MGKYRKRPVVIEALQFNGLDDYFEIVSWMKACGDTHALADEVTYATPIMLIQTLEGTMAAHPGDWIIRGVQGEFYPCKPQIFNETYEPVGDGFLRRYDRSRESDRVPTTYISGPMTGHEDFNRKAFHEAADRLRDLGHQVVNPADVELPDARWEDYMRLDIRLMLLCDQVVVLPGWHESRGARLEVAIATQIGLPIYCLSNDGLDLLTISSELNLTSAGVAV